MFNFLAEVHTTMHKVYRQGEKKFHDQSLRAGKSSDLKDLQSNPLTHVSRLNLSKSCFQICTFCSLQLTGVCFFLAIISTTSKETYLMHLKKYCEEHLGSSHLFGVYLGVNVYKIVLAASVTTKDCCVDRSQPKEEHVYL